MTLKVNAETAARFIHVPQGISEEYKLFLQNATPVGGPVTTPNHWEITRKGFRQWTIAGNDQANADHVESMKRIELGDVPVYEITPKDYSPETPEKILVYIHGGAFTLGSTDHLAQFYAPVAHHANLKCFSIEYPLAPEHPYPAAIESCLKVYALLVDRFKAENIFMMGDSAGGSLVMSVLQKTDKGIPAGICLMSPVADAEKHGPHYSILDGRSPVLDYDLSLLPCLEAYAPGVDLSDADMSPINGSFNNFPPTLVTTGTHDLFAENCYRLVEKMEEAGVKVACNTAVGMGHNYQDRYSIPESQKCMTRIAEFFNNLMK
ncbi:MAG: alpha/beta hydrolase [Chlamydiales bacterium]